MAITSKEIFESLAAIRKGIAEKQSQEERAAAFAAFKATLKAEGVAEEVIDAEFRVFTSAFVDKKLLSEELQAEIEKVENANPRQCNLRVFQAILPYVTLMCAVESKDNATSLAYKLAQMFKDEQIAISCLENFIKMHPLSLEKLDAYIESTENFIHSNSSDINQVLTEINNSQLFINAKDADGMTPLMLAASNGLIEVCEKLMMDGANIHVRNNEAKTALFLAVSNRHADVAMKLIEKGAKDGWSLVEAASNGLVDVCLRLIDNGAAIDVKDLDDSTALQAAAKNGLLAVCQKLIDKNVKINEKDYNDNSALGLAAANGHSDICLLLITNGADIENVDLRTLREKDPRISEALKPREALNRIYKLNDTAFLAEIALLIRDFPGKVSELYHGKENLTLNQLSERILQIDKKNYSGSDIEEAIKEIANLQFNAAITEKLSKQLFYKVLKSAKDEQDVVQIIKHYPGNATDLYPKAKGIEDVIQYFTQAMNDSNKLYHAYMNPAGTRSDWEHQKFHPMIINKFSSLASLKYLRTVVCTSPDFELYLKTYKGPISDLIQNDAYQKPDDVIEFLNKLLENKTILTEVHSNPKKILAVVQKEGIMDEAIQNAFLRKIQEKNLRNMISSTTTYSTLEPTLKEYLALYAMTSNDKKEDVIDKLKAILADPKKQAQAYYEGEALLLELEALNIAPRYVLENILRVTKLEYEQTQYNAIKNFPTTSLHQDEPLRFALTNNLDLAAQALYQQGASISNANIKRFLEEARKDNNQNRVEFIFKLFELKQGSLFANEDELRLAATHANKHFLVKHFQNGLNAERWGTLRAIALFEDNSVLDVPPEYLYGISLAKELAATKKPGEIVTLDEIVAESIKQGKPLSKDIIGQVDTKALEKSVGKKIVKIKYRPNHDLQHSLRAAALIYPLYRLSSTNEKRADRLTSLTNKEIEALQVMMVYSVLGREDETGFFDSQNGGAYLYQSYRAVDAFAFLSYCLEHWDRHYHKVFENKAALYQAALVVELMGYPTIPSNLEALQPRPLMTILMQGDPSKNMPLLKEWIQKYPNNNILRAYSDDQLKALFPTNAVTYKNPRSDIYLNYMNESHGSDLLRCYEPGDPRKLSNSGACIGNLLYFYQRTYESLNHQGKLHEISPAQQVIDYFQFVSGMLDEFGERKRTDIGEVKEALDAAKLLEKFLQQHIGRPFEEVKKIKFEKKIKVNGVEVETLEAFLTHLGLEESVMKTSNLTAPSKITSTSITVIVPRFLAQSFLKAGTVQYSPAAFAHCHYRIKSPAGAEKPQNHDFEKEVVTSLSAIAEIPRPSFCKKTPFEMDAALEKQMRQAIHDACQDGVAIFKSKEEVTIEFSSVEAATGVFDALMKLGKITKMPTLQQSPTAPYVASAKITELEYAFIKPYLKFRKVTPPKQRNEESHLIAPNGNYAVLNLIGEYNAVICNHNARSPVGGSQSGTDWYFNQLEHPSTDRPTRAHTLTEEQRSRVHSAILNKQGERFSVNRGLVTPLPLELQEPRSQPLDKSEYWRSEDPQTRDVFRVRGQPKNTVFAKKSPHTLMVPRGQTLFPGVDRFRYFPIGIISDVNAMHTIGERYIWDRNVGTNEKFWIDGVIHDHELEYKKGMRLEELKTHLRNGGEKFEKWNELLLGGSKSSIRALTCSGDLSFGNKTSLSYRLNLVSQAIFLREKYGLNVPLMIVEGDKAPYLYTEKMLLADIMMAINGLKKDNYPYMSKDNASKEWYKLNCDEQMVLIEFLEVLTGKKFEGKLTLYETMEEYSKNSHPEPYEQYVERIDAENKKRLQAYFQTLDLNANPSDVKNKMDSLKLIGFESSEREYLKRTLATAPLSERKICDLLIRNVALGHVELLKELIQTPEARALLTKPVLPNGGGLLEVAVQNGQLEMVIFLLSQKCNPQAVNNENVSPIALVAKLMSDKNASNQEIYQQIHSELSNYKPMASQTSRQHLRFSESPSSKGPQVILSKEEIVLETKQRPSKS